MISAVFPGTDWKSNSFNFTFGQKNRTTTGINLTSFRFDTSAVRVTKLISIKSFFNSSAANGTISFKIVASVFVLAERNLSSNYFADSLNEHSAVLNLNYELHCGKQRLLFGCN